MFLLQIKTPSQSRTLSLRCLNWILKPEIRKSKTEALSHVEIFSENPSTNVFCFCKLHVIF